jgi:formamidopyrimidine-DNA glycosylase
LKSGEYNRQKHDHLILGLGDHTLVFNDPRRFGLIDYTENIRDLDKKCGIEPLDAEFTVDALRSLLAKCSKNIKNFLLDGTKIAGIGNIYASEALYDSGIHPLRAANTLKPSETRELHKNIITVLKAAIKSGGSTLRDYVRSDGDVGGFQHHFKVYGKNGEQCGKCGNSIEKLVISGRSTFLCPKCQ